MRERKGWTNNPIERRQEKLMQQRDEHQAETPAAPPKPKAKTMGVQVEPELYAKLEKVRDKYKTGSLKAAMLLAAREGLKFLNI